MKKKNVKIVIHLRNSLCSLTQNYQKAKCLTIYRWTEKFGDIYKYSITNSKDLYRLCVNEIFRVGIKVRGIFLFFVYRYTQIAIILSIYNN